MKVINGLYIKCYNIEECYIKEQKPIQQTNNQKLNIDTKWLYLHYWLIVFLLMRQIAKVIHQFHSFEIIHGDIRRQTCVKFGPYWKLIKFYNL